MVLSHLNILTFFTNCGSNWQLDFRRDPMQLGMKINMDKKKTTVTNKQAVEMIQARRWPSVFHGRGVLVNSVLCLEWCYQRQLVLHNFWGVKSFHTPAGIRRDGAKERTNNSLDEVVQNVSYLGYAWDYGAGVEKALTIRVTLLTLKWKETECLLVNKSKLLRPKSNVYEASVTYV